MNRPLHKDGREAKKGLSAHAGLWFDRFFHEYDSEWKVGDQGKTNWIGTVTSAKVGDQQMLEAFNLRQQSLVSAWQGKSMLMTSDWHFVTGMGNNHPVENGFAWHPTLGVPYLTGAAVKGLLRAWCEVWADGFDADKLKRWFGDTKQSGQLIFFDAVPVEPVQLKVDIMTPHYGDWYAKGGEKQASDGSNVPADWHDPVPVPFLVVDKGQSFHFYFASRSGSDINLVEVSEALVAALEWLGAGAKTAIGYGRMSRDSEAESRAALAAEAAKKAEEVALTIAREAAEREARQASMSPLEIELVEWASQPAHLAEAVANVWLDRMEKAEPADARCIALSLKNFFDVNGKWSNPSKKQKEKNSRVKKILER